MKQKPMNFFVKSSEELQCEIINIAIQKLHDEHVKDKDESVAKRLLGLIVEASVDIQSLLNRQNRDEIDLERIEKREKMQTKRVKIKRTKPRPKTNKLRFYKLELIKKKEEGLSFRELQSYLAVEHKFKINYSTIAKEYKKWFQ